LHAKEEVAMRKFVLLLALAAVAAGCKSTPAPTPAPKLADLMFRQVRQLDEIDDFWTIDPYLGERIMLYPVNRLLDAADMISVNAGIGPDLQANAHVTRAVQVGLGAASTARLGFNNHREIGFYRQTGAELSFLALTAEYYDKANVSSWGSVKPILHKANGMSIPGWKIYRESRDYWAIGGHVPALLASAEADVHLKEVPDFVLGFLGVDLGNDDLGVKTGENRLED
jgi:hypothetical protein